MNEQSENLKSGEILKFYKEDAKILESSGFKIYTLSGRPIKSIVADGFKLKGTVGPNLLELTSRKMQVAINPSNLFIPNSSNKTAEEQIKLAASYYSMLAKEIPATFIIDLGSVADWIELAYEHRKATGKHLFDYKTLGGACFTLTNTEDELPEGVVRTYYVGYPWTNGDMQVTRILQDHDKAEALRAAVLIRPIGFGKLNPQNN